jgi:glycosyltransferase involved in cell wall biosynthesis
VLTGYIEDVEPYYSAMDIVVHASIEPEPCGMVVMEAMAARRPIIAADAGGPKELVREGIDGHLTAPGDVPALTAAILDIASQPEKARSMGASGHDRARSLFDIPIASARLEAIYDEMRETGTFSPVEPLPAHASVELA